MTLFGLIGFPLEHSFSERWFNDLFRREGAVDTVYRNFPIREIGLLPELLADNPDLAGFNVTSPYKEAVIPYLDELSPEARKIGAVNCVVRHDGKLCGHNTDHYGFRVSLEIFLNNSTPHTSHSTLKALVLGSGGASKAVRYALDEMSIPCLTVSSRSGQTVSSHNGQADCLRYEDLTSGIVAAHRLIINATPLGMYPDTSASPPFPYELLTPRHLLYDLIYNPPATTFLQKGAQACASVENGHRMLVLQAEKNLKIWKFENLGKR